VVLARLSSPRVERVTKRSWDGVHLNYEVGTQLTLVYISVYWMYIYVCDTLLYFDAKS
jgi:hypothetical protein